MLKIYDFYAKWCNPCKALAKTLETIELPEDIELIKIDVEEDENEELITKFRIKNVPVLVMVDEEGNELKRVGGNIPKPQIIEFITL
jgi:thiol-disulfide isomerase/thioredoxin